jgi:hypothetical protein
MLGGWIVHVDAVKTASGNQLVDHLRFRLHLVFSMGPMGSDPIIQLARLLLIGQPGLDRPQHLGTTKGSTFETSTSTLNEPPSLNVIIMRP